ncbi:reverse transcriptase domain-containing protein [Tanacetum coccineum]
MPPKRTTTTITSPMTNAAIKQLIAQGVADALTEIEANRCSRNGYDSHNSGTSSRRTERAARECTYSDFLKCQPLNFKGTEGVNAMENIKKMMTAKYCPIGEIKKLKIELWNLKGSVMASKPKTMQDAIEFATELMDQKICTFAERQAENKRKLDDDNEAQQQPPKKQNMARTYSAGSSEKKEYAGTLPLCNNCKFHHNGPYTIKCANCKRVGHLTRDCWSPAVTNNQRTLTCYECENQGHYRSDCSELKNQNHENQAGGTEAHGMVYAFGGGETNQDLDNTEDDINA